MGLIPSCKDVHRVVSERLDRDLSCSERVRMRMHIFICGACRNFDGQMDLIRSAMRKLPVPEAHADEPE